MFTTFTNQSKSVHHNPGVNSEVFSNKISTAEHILEHMFNLMHAIPITPRHRKANSEDKQPIQAASPVILITLDLVQSLHGLCFPKQQRCSAYPSLRLRTLAVAWAFAAGSILEARAVPKS